MPQTRIAPLYDLEDLALETGATIEYATGRRFNTAGVQTKRQPKAAMAEVKPETPLAPVSANDDLVKQLLTLLNRPVQVSIPELPAPNVVVNSPAAAAAATPSKWVFEFDRNPNGTIKSITATAAKD